MAGRASVVVEAELATFTLPFTNAITVDRASSLTVTVRNNGDETIRTVDIRMGTTFYTNLSAVAPSSGGFVASVISSNGYGVVRFRVPSCTTGGLLPGASLDFVISFQTPDDNGRHTDLPSAPFQVTATTARNNRDNCGSKSSGTDTFEATIKVLAITGSGPDTLTAPGTTTVRWTIANLSDTTHTNITVGVPVVSPSSGATLTSCDTIPSLGAEQEGTVTCTYALTGGIYTFAAAASDDAGTSTSLAATAGPITVGTLTDTSVVFSRAMVVAGRSPQSISIAVHNGTGQTINRINVTTTTTGWTLVPGAAGGSAVGGSLTYSTTSTPTNVAFNGTLANGGNTVLTINFKTVPATPDRYAFDVRLAYPGGPGTFNNNQVTVVQPVSDPSGTTILATRTSHLLTWGDPSEGSTPAGVVVFRTPAGTVPPLPTDFTVYQANSADVIYVGDGSAHDLARTDTGTASFNYRVCNRDVNYVYSDCNNGFWNNAGWLDSGAPPAAPADGWVHAISGEALHRPGFLTGGRLGIASNGPYINVLDIDTGAMSFTPVKLGSLPPAYTPAFKLTDASGGNTGPQVLYAGENSGQLSKIDLTTGTNLWATLPPKSGSFTAGVSGITAWSATAPSQYRSIYDRTGGIPRDVLLIGTTSGTVYAIDADDGATLWSFGAGGGVHGLITFDAATDRFWVPTAGKGVSAYSIRDTAPPLGATPGHGPAAPASGWVNPESSGDFRLTCVRTAGSTNIACVNASGKLYVMDKTRGAQAGYYSVIQTDISNPTSLMRISGSAVGPGLLVSNTTSVQVIVQGAGTPPVLTKLPAWTPGYDLSAPSVLGDAGFGFFAVGGSDRRVHLVSLTAPYTELRRTAPVSTQAGSLLLGQPIFDTASGLFLFGTSDGHVWALTYPGSFPAVP